MNQMPTKKIKFSKSSKFYEKQIAAADKAISQEGIKQIDILYHSAALALYRYHGWKSERIAKFVNISDKTYSDCIDDDVSMIQLLYNETGIDIVRETSGQNWWDIIYLSTDVDMPPLGTQEFLYMRMQQKKWVASNITASILLALHRKEGWGDKRLYQLFCEMEEIKNDMKLDPKKIKAKCLEETGFKLYEGFELMELAKENNDGK